MLIILSTGKFPFRAKFQSEECKMIVSSVSNTWYISFTLGFYLLQCWSPVVIDICFFFFFTYDLHSIRLQSSIVGQWCVSYSHGDLALLMKLCFSSFLNSFLLSLAVYIFFLIILGGASQLWRKAAWEQKSCVSFTAVLPGTVPLT